MDCNMLVKYRARAATLLTLSPREKPLEKNTCYNNRTRSPTQAISTYHLDNKATANGMNKSTTKNTDTAAAAINADYVTTFTVPTKGATSTDEAPKRVIDTRNLSEEDLKALRKQDPFLYYSIQ
eukprot:scaffold37202_cov150-Skeletonema_dohrnii-CCMP3373.AAC.1